MSALTRQSTFFLPEMIVAAGAMGILLWGILFPRRRSANLSLVALAVLTMALFSLIGLLNDPAATAGGSMAAPGILPVLFRIMIVFGASLVVFLSHDYLVPASMPPRDYYLMMLLATLGMMVTAAAGNLLLLFLGIELMSLSFAILAASLPGSAGSKEASLKYLLYSLTASAVLLFGLSLAYGVWGSWDLAVLASSPPAGNAGPAVALALVCLLVGFGFKLGLVPFHMWIPDVYQGSPAPVTAFLSTGPKVAVFGAAATLLVGALGGAAPRWHPLLWWMSVLSMTWGNAAALVQRDLKRMMGYSGIAQAGYITIGLLSSTRQPEEGIGGLGFYLFTYLFFNIGLFALISGSEGADGRGPRLENIAGLGRRQPWQGAAFSLFLLALAGVPPTSGFMAKFSVFLAAVRADLVGLAVLGILNSILAAYYYLRVIWYLYLKDPEEGVHQATVPFNFALFAVLLCVVCTLVFGLFPGPLLGLMARASSP